MHPSLRGEISVSCHFDDGSVHRRAVRQVGKASKTRRAVFGRACRRGQECEKMHASLLFCFFRLVRSSSCRAQQRAYMAFRRRPSSQKAAHVLSKNARGTTSRCTYPPRHDRSRDSSRGSSRSSRASASPEASFRVRRRKAYRAYCSSFLCTSCLGMSS